MAKIFLLSRVKNCKLKSFYEKCERKSFISNFVARNFDHIIYQRYSKVL